MGDPEQGATADEAFVYDMAGEATAINVDIVDNVETYSGQPSFQVWHRLA